MELSVSDILSEFWANYSEEETPAPREDAPRSRREAARIREEASSLPPTDAAPSAAETAPRRREKEQRSRPASGKASASSDASRPTRQKRGSERNRKEPAPTAEAAPAPEAAPPAPLAPSEAAEAFGFLRRARREKAFPEKKESLPQWNARSATAIWTVWRHCAVTKEHFKKEAHLHAFFRRNQPAAV